MPRSRRGKKQEMSTDYFAALKVLLPRLVYDDWKRSTNETELLTGLNFEEEGVMEGYQGRLDRFVYSKPRDYIGFRGFIEEHCVLYGDDYYEYLAELTDAQIDSIFGHLKEEREKYWRGERVRDKRQGKGKRSNNDRQKGTTGSNNKREPSKPEEEEEFLV